MRRRAQLSVVRTATLDQCFNTLVERCSGFWRDWITPAKTDLVRVALNCQPVVEAVGFGTVTLRRRRADPATPPLRRLDEEHAVVPGAWRDVLAAGLTGHDALGRAGAHADLRALLMLGLFQLAGFFALSHAGAAWVPAGRTAVLSNATTIWIVPESTSSATGV